MCRAIISSSLVGITQAAARLLAVLMRGPPVALACASSSTPSQAAPRQTRSRTNGFVLADAAGEHDRVEAAERRRQRAELALDPVDEQIDRQRRARIASRRATSRMSLDMPDTPSRPDCV